jgi:hypothetical protein
MAACDRDSSKERKFMLKQAITTLCTVALLLAATTAALANPPSKTDVVAADAVVMRPALLVATILGSAIFVVSLPFAAISKSIKPTAHALVVAPAKATFTRPLGDFAYHENPANNPLAAYMGGD